MAYQNISAGTGIGSLLRLIQEEKAAQESMAAPNAQVSTPMREMVTGPLKSEEAVGSSRVVSARPEMDLMGGVPGAAGTVGQTPQMVVQPGMAGGSVGEGGVVKPIVHTFPEAGASPGGEMMPGVNQGISGGGSPSPSPTPSQPMPNQPAMATGPRLGTVLGNQAPVNYGALQSRPTFNLDNFRTRSTVGPPKAEITQAPSQKKYMANQPAPAPAPQRNQLDYIAILRKLGLA